MMRILLLAFLALVQVAIGAPLQDEPGPLHGYQIGEMAWRGVVVDGEAPVELTGSSLEDIEKQAQAINPGYSISSISTPETSALSGQSPADSVMKRQAGWGNHFCWFDKDNQALAAAIEEGGKYLRGIKGDCRSPPGPRYCGRVSCSYHSGIFFCNDHNREIWIPCHTLGEYAQEIWNRCSRATSSFLEGQLFTGDGKYNVLATHADC